MSNNIIIKDPEEIINAINDLSENIPTDSSSIVGAINFQNLKPTELKTKGISSNTLENHEQLVNDFSNKIKTLNDTMSSINEYIKSVIEVDDLAKSEDKDETTYAKKTGDQIVKVKEKETVPPTEVIKSISLLEALNIYDKDGNIIGKLGIGEYQVYETKYDEFGNIIAVKISEDEDKWIKYKELKKDVKTINVLQDLNIYDKDGNIIGKLGIGEYQIYEIKYDEFGNIIAVKISKDEDKWIKYKELIKEIEPVLPETYEEEPKKVEIVKEVSDQAVVEEILDNNSLNQNSNNEEIVEDIDKYNPTAEGKIKSFSNKTAIIGGIIGILSIATVGVGMYIKNKKGEKVSQLESGEYNIYDYKYDQNGNPAEARISPKEDDEYWVNFN